ncbi:MAG: hypothetical protein ACI3VA_11640 [Candidatus Limivicinus sp.]|nr:hypothetical protein [Candidatus Limivicinus sp.]
METQEIEKELKESCLDLMENVCILQSVLRTYQEGKCFGIHSGAAAERMFSRLNDYIEQNTGEIESLSAMLVKNSLR